MAMKYLRKYYVDRDQNGKAQPGSVIVAYPTGTSVNGSTASAEGLMYKMTIDPIGNNNRICSHYDIYINAVMKWEHVVIGKWEWFVRIQFTDTDLSQDFLFADLVDENGHDVPDSIPKAIVGIMNAEADRHFSISAQDDSGFTIDAAAMGGASVPIYVNLHITVKEPS